MRPKRARSEAPNDVTVEQWYRGVARISGRPQRSWGSGVLQHGAAGNGRYGDPMRLADTVAAALAGPAPPRCRRGRVPARRPHRRRRRPGRGRGGERVGRLSRRSTRWRPGSGSVGAPSSSGTRSSGSCRRRRPSTRLRSPMSSLRASGRSRASARTARSSCAATASDDACSSAPLLDLDLDPCSDVVSPASGEWRTSLDRDDFEARVEAILDLLRAGDCYQVNLTRRLTGDVGLDPVAVYTALAACHPAPHTGVLRLAVQGRPIAVVSASPERFLSWSGRDVETRPIKGTDADAHRLRASAKDHAENVMIVDLARNDLGRVCEPGSMQRAVTVRARDASWPAPSREHRPRHASAPMSAWARSSRQRSRRRR